VGLRFDAIAVVRKSCIDIFIAEFTSQKLASEEGGIAYENIATWPFALGVKLERFIRRMFASLCFLQRLGFAAKMRDEERVFVLEVFQILKNRLTLVRETVVPPPFQIADLHRDLREFEGIGVQFDRL